MKMRNEGDISALLTVQWGFKIIFKQWMTICLHTRSLMVVVAMEQGVGAAERWTGGVSSVSHTHKYTEVKARWIFSCQCKKNDDIFFSLTHLTAHNPLSPEHSPQQARCVTVTDV